MTRGHPTAVALLAALLVAGTASCGGEEQPSASEPTEQTDSDSAEAGAGAAADVTTCTDEAEAAPTPYGDRFPGDWPFPPESVVFNVEDRGDDGTIVTAVTSSDFQTVLDFMNGEVVDAGYAIEEGETEEHDAEAEWEGNGFRGRWAIRESANCEGETVVQVLSTDE